LFRTIDFVLNALQTNFIDSSSTACENFLSFLKISLTWASISHAGCEPSVSVTWSAVFDQFELVSLSSLHEIVGYLQPAGSDLFLCFKGQHSVLAVI